MRWPIVARAFAVAGLVGLLSWALLSVPYVPSHDGPAHFASCVLSARLQDASSGLDQFLQPGSPITTQGFQVPCAAFVRVLDPFAAYAATLVFMALLFAGGFAFMLRRFDPKSPWWPLGFALALSWAFSMGFWSYYVAVGLSFWACGLVLAGDPSRPRPAAFVGLAALLWLSAYSHAFQSALGGLVVLSIALLRAPAGRRVRAAAFTVLAGLPAFIQFTRMLAVYLFADQFAGASESVFEAKGDAAATLADLAATYLGGHPVRAWGAFAGALAMLSVAAASARRLSRVQQAIASLAVLMLAIALLSPFHLPRWHYFAPRLTLFPLAMLALAMPPLGRVARWVEGALVVAAAASLLWAAGFNQRVYAAIAPDLAALDADVTRTKKRLPLILTQVSTELEHFDPEAKLGQLYLVRQGGISSFVWAGEPALDPIRFKRPVEEDFGDEARRYPAAPFAAVGLAGQQSMIDLFAAQGRAYEDVIVASDAGWLVPRFQMRGYRVRYQAERSAILEFEGCPLAVTVRGPGLLPNGLIVQVGVEGLERPVEQVILPPGTKSPDGIYRPELPRQLCGRVWALIQSGTGADGPPLRCQEFGGNPGLGFDLPARGLELTCTLTEGGGDVSASEPR